MMRFEGRAVYVTGAGHGIGRATALRIASEGGRIAVSDIDAGAARAVADEIAAANGTAFATSCDLTDAETIEASLAGAVECLGRLDVLVNTAGGDWHEPAFEEISDELWARKLDVNLTGVVRLIRAALPSLLASGPGANVVSIGSINSMVAFGSYPYSAAKAGLETVTRNLAVRYGRQGLRFNMVAPGTVRTRVWDGREARLAELAQVYPLGRVGEPADIAAAVAFLASDDAAWITGLTLPVEGGLTTGALGGLIAGKG